MVIFDVDGTLIGGETIDWASFDAAFQEVTGFLPSADFYAALEEVTVKSIVHEALAHLPAAMRSEMEAAIAQRYVCHLRVAVAADPACFPASEGAMFLLEDLCRKGFSVAIATGDWRESIIFKLGAAGLPVDNIPIATASEFYSRADIIRAAAQKAGRAVEDAIYVGDGAWDLRACKQLGIPFLGTGKNRHKLQSAGALHLLEDLHPSSFWPVHDMARTHFTSHRSA